MNCTLFFATKRKDKKYKGRTTKVPTKYPDKIKKPTAKKDRTNAENIFGANGCFIREFLISSTSLEYHKNRQNTSFLQPFTWTLL